MEGKAYNPLHKENLGQSVATALLASEPRPFTAVEDLVGAGVYAIYYTGPSDYYVPVATRNANGAYGWPIYVGKAIPKGGRKGGVSFDSEQGRALRDRLGNHAKSTTLTFPTSRSALSSSTTSGFPLARTS